MADVIENLRELSDGDRQALAAYFKRVDAVE